MRACAFFFESIFIICCVHTSQLFHSDWSRIINWLKHGWKFEEWLVIPSNHRHERVNGVIWCLLFCVIIVFFTRFCSPSLPLLPARAHWPPTPVVANMIKSLQQRVLFFTIDFSVSTEFTLERGQDNSRRKIWVNSNRLYLPENTVHTVNPWNHGNGWVIYTDWSEIADSMNTAIY